MPPAATTEGPADTGGRPRLQDRRPGGSGSPNITQVFALVVGVTYLAVGVVGFAITGFSGFIADGADDLLGFDINPFHNVVHLTIGGLFLLVSRLEDPAVTQGVVIGGGLVYVLAAVLGIIGSLGILSIDGVLASDNFLHLFSGLAAVGFGLAGARQTDAARAA